MPALRFRLSLVLALVGALLVTTGCANFPANKPTAVEKQPAPKVVGP